MSKMKEAAGCLGTALVLVGFIVLITVIVTITLILGLIGHALDVFIGLALIVMAAAGGLFWFVANRLRRSP